MSKEEMFTVRDTAELLGISQSMTYAYLTNGFLTGQKIGNKTYVSPDSIEKLLKRREEKKFLASDKGKNRRVYNSLDDQQKDDLDLTMNLIFGAFGTATKAQKDFLVKAFAFALDAPANESQEKQAV